MEEWLARAVEYARVFGVNYGWSTAVLLLLELLWPMRRYSLSSRARALLFWAVFVALNALALTSLGLLREHLNLQPLVKIRAYEPFLTLGEPFTSVGLVGAAMLSSVVGDFFYYWFHRAQHSWSFLWRFHAVHHSIRELSVVNSYNHVTELVFRVPFVALPAGLLAQIDPGPTPLIALLFFTLQARAVHSPTRVGLGPLRGILAENTFHRYHHSIEPEHWGKNFGAVWTVWDRLFGTAYLPARGEWPDTGVPGVPEITTLNDYLFRPFHHPGPAMTAGAGQVRYRAATPSASALPTSVPPSRA